MGQQNVRIRIGGRKSVVICVRIHGQGIFGFVIVNTAIIMTSHLCSCSNCIFSFVFFSERIGGIVIDNWCNHCRRANLVRISGNVIVRDKPVSVHSAGNIRIVIQIVFQQVFLFHAVYHIVRLCIGKGLDAEIVQTAVANCGILFLLFCQFSCRHCLFGVVFFLGENLHHIPLGRIIIVDLSIIECHLIYQLSGSILVVQLPVQRLVVFVVVRGIARAIRRNRNDAIGQNVGDDRQRERTLLTAVCTIAVQRFFVVVPFSTGTAAVAVLIPVIIILHMDIDPVDLALCLGVVLLYRLAIHLGFILTDGFADGCPAAYQRFPQHGSGAGFRVEHGLTAAVTVNAVIVGKAIAAAVCYDFLVLDIVAVDRRHIRRGCQVFQTSKLSVAVIPIPIQRTPEVVHAVQLVVLCQHLGGTVPVVDVIDLVIQMILATLCHIGLGENTIVPCAACRIGVYSCRKCHPCDIAEVAAPAVPFFQ